MSREKSNEKGNDQDAKSTKSTTPNDKHAYIFRDDCCLLAGAIWKWGSPLSR
ncbi:hypothetical protein PBN151_2886 [Paenibacillus sp. NAIST15-1]|nr:hypothetical protein PBN151_2886 [Paenibacillus sp. NAIST15-1]